MVGDTTQLHMSQLTCEMKPYNSILVLVLITTFTIFVNVGIDNTYTINPQSLTTLFYYHLLISTDIAEDRVNVTVCIMIIDWLVNISHLIG